MAQKPKINHNQFHPCEWERNTHPTKSENYISLQDFISDCNKQKRSNNSSLQYQLHQLQFCKSIVRQLVELCFFLQVYRKSPHGELKTDTCFLHKMNKNRTKTKDISEFGILKVIPSSQYQEGGNTNRTTITRMPSSQDDVKSIGHIAICIMKGIPCSPANNSKKNNSNDNNSDHEETHHDDNNSFLPKTHQEMKILFPDPALRLVVHLCLSSSSGPSRATTGNDNTSNRTDGVPLVTLLALIYHLGGHVQHDPTAQSDTVDYRLRLAVIPPTSSSLSLSSSFLFDAWNTDLARLARTYKYLYSSSSSSLLLETTGITTTKKTEATPKKQQQKKSKERVNDDDDDTSSNNSSLDDDDDDEDEGEKSHQHHHHHEVKRSVQVSELHDREVRKDIDNAQTTEEIVRAVSEFAPRSIYDERRNWGEQIIKCLGEEGFSKREAGRRWEQVRKRVVSSSSSLKKAASADEDNNDKNENDTIITSSTSAITEEEDPSKLLLLSDLNFDLESSSDALFGAQETIRNLSITLLAETDYYRQAWEVYSSSTGNTNSVVDEIDRKRRKVFVGRLYLTFRVCAESMKYFIDEHKI